MIGEHLVKIEHATGLPDEVAELSELARKEGHDFYHPTDVIWKNGERVGLFSVSTYPMVLAFLSKKCLPRDSATAINIIEQIVKRATGTKTILVPVNRNSSFYDKMESLGYKKDETITYFYKNV